MERLKQNQHIKHQQYGLGVVSQTNAERTTIDFELHGVKKFVTDLMRCEVLADQAPVKASAAKKRVKKPSGSRSTKSKADQSKA